jgi:ribosomal protein S3
MRSFYIDEVLREWKKESGLTHLMLYKVKNGVITIYTDRPGVLIGFMGERINRFTEKLKSVPFPGITEVKIEETDGIA